MKDTLKNVLIQTGKKNIVFYGISQNKCRLSEKEKKNWNAYYMDIDIPVKAEEACLLNSFAQAAEKKIDAFIVMRQMIANQGAFGEMLTYCREHKADIYDASGRNIGKVCEAAVEQPYCNRENLEAAIEQHTYISFDIFDTLLTRKVLMPQDVFDLVERRLVKGNIKISEFRKKRMQAQEDLGLTNPTLDEIYEKFQRKYRIEPDIVKICKDAELAVEREVLIPRKDMVEIFKMCVAAGKKVFLVSDMYLTAQMLEPVLKENGITGYQGIYISCDKKQLKLQGLLETYRDDCEENGTYLHIGDHVIHDGICAGLAGMDYCLIANSYKAAQKTAYKNCMDNAENLEERLMLGLSIAKILNSPFAVNEKNGEITIEKDGDFGYGFCAVILSQFTQFIYDQVQKQNVDEILFAARDGYFMQKMYHLLCGRRNAENMPEGIYFYTSRKAAVMTCINNEAYINMLIDISPGMPPKKLMKERFGLSPAQILPFDPQKYDGIDKYVWKHAESIFKRSEEAKQNYFKYMGNISLKIGAKYAFMDFVSSGTSQKSLEKICPFEICGIYAGWNSSERKEDFHVDALYSDTDTFFLKYYKVIETFMTSEEPSLSHFDKNGNPVFQKQERNEKEISYVREMQKACMEFFKDFLELFGSEKFTIDNNFADSIFAVSGNVKFKSKDSALNHISLMDDWRQMRVKKDKLIQSYNRR